MSLSLKPNLNSSENKHLRVEFTHILAQRIKDLRKRKNLTQEALAEAAGLHPTYLAHLEKGTYHPTAFITWKIAKALKVKTSELLDI